MSDQPKEPSPEKAENAKQPEQSENRPPKKPWKTPKVIVSSMHKAEAKSPPLNEASPFFSPTIGTTHS